jgi:hypothetical protein
MAGEVEVLVLGEMLIGEDQDRVRMFGDNHNGPTRAIEEYSKAKAVRLIDRRPGADRPEETIARHGQGDALHHYHRRRRSSAASELVPATKRHRRRMRRDAEQIRAGLDSSFPSHPDPSWWPMGV